MVHDSCTHWHSAPCIRVSSDEPLTISVLMRCAVQREWQEGESLQEWETEENGEERGNHSRPVAGAFNAVNLLGTASHKQLSADLVLFQTAFGFTQTTHCCDVKTQGG